MRALGEFLLVDEDSPSVPLRGTRRVGPMPEALYIKRVSDILSISPLELLGSDPGLISQLLEVASCEGAVEVMGQDLSKLTRAHYAVLKEMGWGEDVPDEALDQADERWLLG